MHLFGKKPKPITVESSIHRTQDTADSIQKRITHIEQQITQEHNYAQVFSKNGNKKAALLCLKKKKLFESQLNTLYNQLTNLQSLGSKLEETIINKDVFEAQIQGASGMKNSLKGMNIDKITNTMDDIHETMEDAEEISTLISTPLTTFDDMDLEAELGGLEDELLMDITIPKGNPTPRIETVKIQVKI